MVAVRVALSIVGALLVTWLVFIAALALFRPRGMDVREAKRLGPDIARLIKDLATDTTLPRAVRRRLGVLVVYLALPFDLVPDFIPVLGFADDVIVTALVLRSVVRRAGADAVQQHWRGTEAGLGFVSRLAGIDRYPPARATGPTTQRRRRVEPSVLAAIALGGALGAPARYGVAQLVQVPTNGFPWATFWTNVSGSLALGIVLALVLERFPPTRFVRPFVATGFLGAYTTYSTFAVESDLLVKNGRAAIAVAYVIASFVVGFVAVAAGMWAGRLVPLSRRGDR